MGKKKAEEFQQDTNAWMTTYTDLMTLLLTFFVLLLSMSVIDSRKQREALNSLVGAFGFKPGAHSVIGSEKGMNITAGSAPITREEIDFERLQNIIFKNGLRGEVQVKREGNRTIVSLNEKVLFENASFTLREETRGFLAELAGVIKGAPGLIELRGYAHSSETVFEPQPYRKAMFLSARRALAVYHFLGTSGGVPPKKMVAHGFGTRVDQKSVGKDQAECKRQVEIICDYRTKIPFSLRRKAKNRDLLLEFKGFMFHFIKRRGS